LVATHGFFRLPVDRFGIKAVANSTKRAVWNWERLGYDKSYCFNFAFLNLNMMAVDFPPTTEELLETFDDLPDWDERYDFLIDLGRELPQLDEKYCTPENKVDGCLSTVWLVAEKQNDRLQILADSDSIIVKGLIVVLLSLYHDCDPKSIIEIDPQQFFKKLGLEQHLSHGRRNGLYSMVERVRQLAVETIAG
jgi:cysteine desulfuration protein SufE